jgi:hypothetical protein
MAVKNSDAFHQLRAYDDEMAGKQRYKRYAFSLPSTLTHNSHESGWSTEMIFMGSHGGVRPSAA